ncbi:hypothetical protein BOVAC1_1499 [Bacteroides ovatus]|nr:hypothetical protein BOVAC1_1499 [Bacteroides ovatus]
MRKTIITAALAVILLAGCETKQVEEVKASTNPTYRVEKLFTVDDITVYRFKDNSRYVYFTNRTGRVEYDHTHMVGKTVVTEREQTICNGDGQEDKH